MSRIQAALDEAENPIPEPPQPEITQLPAAGNAQRLSAVDLVAAPGHQEPRLNSIRFYEAQNQAVEESLKEQKKDVVDEITGIAKESGVSSASPDSPEGKKFLGAVLALLAVSFIACCFIFPSFKNGSEKNSVSTVSLEAVPAAVKPAPVKVRLEKNPAKKASGQVQFLLTGITRADNTLLALINNQVVGVGDQLREGALVKSITDKSVILEVNGRQFTLYF